MEVKLHELSCLSLDGRLWGTEWIKFILEVVGEGSILNMKQKS
jgi:hypothetical protein